MAANASNGFRAERMLCVQRNVKEALQNHFSKPICSIEDIKGRKKSDNQILFEDTTRLRIQNKDGQIGGRGFSVNRGEAQTYTSDKDVHTLLKNVCLKEGSVRPEVSNSMGRLLLDQCFLGSAEDFKPQYFLHTKSDKQTGIITSLSICDTESFMEEMYTSMYPNLVPKRTCVHINPYVYLQRKAGGTADHSPNQIQAKFRLDGKILEKFIDLPLTQTMLQLPAQTP
jgi:hypothetical protein